MTSSTSPELVPVKAKRPWSLVSICWICVLSGVVPALLLWGLNNRRLNNSPARLTRGFVWATTALYCLAVVRALLAEEDSFSMHRFQAIGFLVTLIAAWQFYTSQRVSFVCYCKAGGKTAALGWPIFSGAMWLLLLVISFGAIETVRIERDQNKFEAFAKSLHKGNFKDQEAERFFLEFKRKYPEDSTTHWNLAIIYAQTNRVKQAKEELHELLEVEPNDKDARDYLRELEDY